jgi:hypothetical protein
MYYLGFCGTPHFQMHSKAIGTSHISRSNLKDLTRSFTIVIRHNVET